MQNEIEEFQKNTPEELQKKEKKLKWRFAKTRSVALEELIARSQTIKEGVSAEEVEAAFGSVGKHEFTDQREGRIFSCFSYFVGKEYWAKRATKYYCLFEDNKLFSILVPPPFEYDYVPYRGSTCEIKKPVDSYKRIDQVFKANNLLDQGLVDSLKKRFPRKSSSSNLGPLVGFMKHLPSSFKKQREVDVLKREKLEKKYNSVAVELGMNKSNVELILGFPKHVHKKDSSIIRIYGEVETFIYYPYSLPWIAVEYENSKAVRVITRDFFNDELLK